MFVIDNEQEICMFPLYVLIVHIDLVVFCQLSLLGNQVTDFPPYLIFLSNRRPLNIILLTVCIVFETKHNKKDCY